MMIVSEGRTVHLQLPELYVGQMLDGLEVLAEQWEQTAKIMADDDFATDEIMIHECSDASEASSIAQFYRQIHRTVQEQL